MASGESALAPPARRKWFVAVTAAVLALQCLVLVLLPKQESISPGLPLASFPAQLDAWSMTAEEPLDPEVQKVLRADDTLSRTYRRSSLPASANLFIAFYKSQRSGVAPHSPKNCLPGSGWLPVSSGTTVVPIPGADPLTINRYIVQRGSARSLVLYWYQTSTRAVASEYLAKIYLVLDAILLNRSDTSIVRVVVNLPPEDQAGVSAAEQDAVSFIQAFYGALKAHLPS